MPRIWQRLGLTLHHTRVSLRYLKMYRFLSLFRMMYKYVWGRADGNSLNHLNILLYTRNILTTRSINNMSVSPCFSWRDAIYVSHSVGSGSYRCRTSSIPIETRRRCHGKILENYRITSTTQTLCSIIPIAVQNYIASPSLSICAKLN